jgi:hypothetical protein
MQHVAGLNPAGSDVSPGFILLGKLNSTLLAKKQTQAIVTHSSEKNTKSSNVEILPPRNKGGGANTGSLPGQA